MGWCGSQTCPFNNLSDKDIKSGSYDFTVENIKTNDIIKFSSLIAHLIRDHHFCEGDTPQRLDPEYGIKVFELKPNVNYEPVIETEYVWNYVGSRGTHTNDIPYKKQVGPITFYFNDTDGYYITTDENFEPTDLIYLNDVLFTTPFGYFGSKKIIIKKTKNRIYISY